MDKEIIGVTETMKVSLYRNLMRWAVSRGVNDMKVISSVILRLYPKIVLEKMDSAGLTLLEGFYLFDLEHMDYLVF